MPARSWSAVRAFVAPVLRDRRGVAAVFLAVALIRWSARSASRSTVARLPAEGAESKSLDAARLAAGRKALDDDAEEIARAYFDANFGEDLGDIELTDFQFALDDEQRHVTLSARGADAHLFMRVFGQDEMNVCARTVIKRQTTGMELALVMDNTGSLWNSVTKTDLDRHAVRGDPGRGSEPHRHHLRRGGRARQRLGEPRALRRRGQHRSFAHRLACGGRPGADQPGELPAGISPGAAGRAASWPARIRGTPTNSTPSTHPFTSFFWARTTTDNNWQTSINDAYTGTNQARKGPNLGCGTPITPLTASRDTVEDGINAMRPWRRGGTTGNLGLVWGWRTISPTWRGLWGNADLPLDYGTDFMDKVVVMLTDGNNTFYNLPDSTSGDPTTPSDFTAYGRLNAPGPVGLNVATTGAGETILNTRMTAICTAMKTEKIKIYTIIFGTAPSATTQALYRELRDLAVNVLLRPEQRRARLGLPRDRRAARQPADHRMTRMATLRDLLRCEPGRPRARSSR